MMRSLTRFGLSLALGALGVLCFAVSADLITRHAVALTEVQNVSLPLVAQLPQLEQRLDGMREQVEMAEISRRLQRGSEEERLNLFVLPKEMNIPRVLSVIEAMVDALVSSEDIQAFGQVELGEDTVQPSGLGGQAVRLQFVVSDQGAAQVLAAFRMAGLLTVADAFDEAQLRRLLETTEAESPAGLVALEHFLAADLLSFSLEPQPYLSELFKMLPGERFAAAFADIRDKSLLPGAQEFLSGPFGTRLHEQGLWPMPMMQVKGVTAEAHEGGWLLTLQLLIAHRP